MNESGAVLETFGLEKKKNIPAMMYNVYWKQVLEKK